MTVINDAMFGGGERDRMGGKDFPSVSYVFKACLATAEEGLGLYIKQISLKFVKLY